MKDILLGDDVRCARAVSEQSVTLLLEDEVDVSRGDLLVRAGGGARADAQGRRDAVLALRAAALPQRRYLVRHTTRESRRRWRRSPGGEDLAALGAGAGGRPRHERHRPRLAPARAAHRRRSATRTNRATGAFIVVDESTNDTVGAGMIL